jgi:hypothetical protein
MFRNMLLFFQDERDMPVIYNTACTTGLLTLCNLLLLVPQIKHMVDNWAGLPV